MKKTAGQYPTKKTINLVVREKSKTRPGRVIPMVLVVAALAAIFGKLAVADRLARVEQARTALSEVQLEVAELMEITAEYDEIQLEYGRFTTSWMTDEEHALVDRLAVLELVRGELIPGARVKQFSVNGNQLAVDLAGVTLEGTSGIVQRLSALDLVDSVAVYTASTQMQSGEEAEISMTITLSQSGALARAGAEGGEG